MTRAPQPPADPALELEHRRVVRRSRAGAAPQVDIGELRERPQQLPARDRCAGQRASGQRRPEERVRHRLVQRGAKRQMLHGHLVDVEGRVRGPAPGEVVRSGCRCSPAETAMLLRQLALEVHRVLLDARRPGVLIDEVHRSADARQAAAGAAGRLRETVRERIRDAAAGAWREPVVEARDVVGDGGEPARPVGALRWELALERCPEQSVAAAHDGRRVQRIRRTRRAARTCAASDRSGSVGAPSTPAYSSPPRRLGTPGTWIGNGWS